MKSDFPILNSNPNLIYLDNAATTQKPRVVIEAIKEFYETSNANIHRGIYSLSEHSTILFQQAREKVAKFINAETIVFTSGATQSLNILAQSLNLQEGDEIVLTEMEHHSNLVPWQEVAKLNGCILKYIPVVDYKLDLQAAEKLITKKTKVVSFVHMSNVLGTINPVKEITKMAHLVGAVIIIDAAQSVAHEKIDVQDLNCDYLVFSGHKMCGPTGIGVLYAKNFFSLKPVNFGGGMVEKVDWQNTSYLAGEQKMEAGTPNIAGAIGLAAAVEYLEGVDFSKMRDLAFYAHQKISQLPNVKILGPISPVVSFVVDGMHPHDVAEILNRSNIAVRAGHHCAQPLMKKLDVIGTTRASFYIYNTQDDVDSLVDGIKQAQVVFA